MMGHIQISESANISFGIKKITAKKRKNSKQPIKQIKSLKASSEFNIMLSEKSKIVW